MPIDLPSITEATADALLASGKHDDTGIDYIPEGTDDNDSPDLITRIVQWQEQLNWSIRAMNEGCVYDKTPNSNGLTVIVRGLPRFVLAGTTYTSFDDEEFVCTDDSTCYLYVDSNETVEEDTSSWPGTAHFKLAVVTTSGGNITSIKSALKENFDPNASSPWYGVQAAGNVDVNGYNLREIGEIEMDDPSTLTLSSGSITPVSSFHVIAAESGTTDDLDTIVVDAAKIGRILFLKADSGDTITITSSGNISILNNAVAQPTLSGGAHPNIATFIQSTATEWEFMGNSYAGVTSILSTVDVANERLNDLGPLNFYPRTRTISGGIIAALDCLHVVDTEGAAASDDLDSMTGGTADDVAILMPANTARTVVIKHGTGSDEFLLQNGLDFTMDSTECAMICRYDGTNWVEIARSPQRARDLVTSADEDRCVPYTPGSFFVSGALSAAVQKPYLYCPVDFTIENITGYVEGAPSGGSCIVDLQDDSASIFSNESEMIVITDGNNSDTSATKSHKVSAGSWLRLEVKSTGSSPNGADDLTVTINGYANLQTSPHA